MRRAVNGCNDPVSFKNIPVYYNWVSGDFDLGNQLNKDDWILKNIKNKDNYESVRMMLLDWELYENGWLLIGHKDCRLFYYICQIDYHKPEALVHIQEVP